MTKQRVIVLSDAAAEFLNTPAPMPVIEDIYSISDKRAWVVVATEFQQEKKARDKLEEANVATYLPIERAYVRKSRVTTTMVAGMVRRTRTKTVRRPVERPLLPGYLFAEVPSRTVSRKRYALRDNGWVEDGKSSALEVDKLTAARLSYIEGVASLLGCSNGPLPVPSEFVDLLRQNQGFGAFDRTSGGASHWAKQGQRVAIADGPFATFLGIVEECLPKDILKVAVEIFGRKTPVLLELAQLEKA